MFNERFHDAAERVLGGDESVAAAKALEQAIQDHHAGDPRFGDLLGVIATYAPDEEAPDVEGARLRTAVRDALGVEKTSPAQGDD